MKKLLSALLLTTSTLCMAQSADELRNDGKNTENLLSFWQNPKLQMYSPLRQINKSNVRRLVPLHQAREQHVGHRGARERVYQFILLEMRVA